MVHPTSGDGRREEFPPLVCILPELSLDSRKLDKRMRNIDNLHLWGRYTYDLDLRGRGALCSLPYQSVSVLLSFGG